tara:strand:- start:1166 stop:1366 length:201 start_codon:yes stop_codon:yes gene_type:complete
MNNLLVNYRIIKVDDICPWQVQKRSWLFRWSNVCLSFSSVKTAGDHLSELLKGDEFNKSRNKTTLT